MLIPSGRHRFPSLLWLAIIRPVMISAVARCAGTKTAELGRTSIADQCACGALTGDKWGPNRLNCRKARALQQKNGAALWNLWKALEPEWHLRGAGPPPPS